MQERVEWALRDALVQHPGFRVVTAGHSLGGALAHLAAAYLRQDLPILRTAFPAAAASNRRSLQPTGLYPASKLPYQRRAVAAEGPEAVDVYSYGAPRFANCALSRFVSDPYRSPGNDVRVTHTDDPVPHLPPALLGFRHTGVEMWLASGPSRGVRFKTSDVQICRGPLNMACNGGTFGIDFDAHRYYFRRVGACGGWGWGWRSRRHARDGSRMGTAVADKTRNETAGGYYDGYLFSAAVVAAENAEMSKLNGFTATDLTPAARKELEDKVQADIAFAVEFMTTDSC